MLALKLEEETTDCRQLLQAKKSQGMASPLGPPERNALTLHRLLTDPAEMQQYHGGQGSAKPALFTIWPVTEKFASLWCYDCLSPKTCFFGLFFFRNFSLPMISSPAEDGKVLSPWQLFSPKLFLLLLIKMITTDLSCRVS